MLVGVVKNKRDLVLLMKERWYRIPVAHLPKRKIDYIAFYQPVVFGAQGKRIRYYARVIKYQMFERRELLPCEASHPSARAKYARIAVGSIKELPRAIRNTSPRRVSFGFTTLNRLFSSKNILQLYNVAETEEMLSHAFREAHISALPQYWVIDRKSKTRYRLDFAIFCEKGKIAVECDNTKAHSGSRMAKRDQVKDAFLANRGWTMMRLKEADIISDTKLCVVKIQKTIRKLGGLKRS